MDYRDRLIRDLSERACKRITRRVIRTYRGRKEGMQSGDDTPLMNLWDEICVQAQGEKSFFWDAYLENLFQVISAELMAVSNTTKAAIWLQTQRGEDWELGEACDDEGTPLDVDIPFLEEDIAEHIRSHVLSTASDWSNRRIRKYLEREHD